MRLFGDFWKAKGEGEGLIEQTLNKVLIKTYNVIMLLLCNQISSQTKGGKNLSESRGSKRSKGGALLER